MLPGFEDITDDLTDHEIKVLLPIFLKALSKKIGPELAITNKEIRNRLAAAKLNITDVTVRKIISYIRTNCLLDGLVASSKGYYISVDPTEIQRYVDSLEGREQKIRHIKENMKQYLRSLTNGQAKLF